MIVLKSVMEVLRMIKIVITDSSLFRAGKCKLLKVWHDIDVRVAGYFVEVIDSVDLMSAMIMIIRMMSWMSATALSHHFSSLTLTVEALHSFLLLSQAVDNAKFLGAAEQYIHAIYLEDPGKMRTPIMRLLYTVKMIFNVSTYFNNSVRISSLLVKITNQIIISCKR